MDSEKIGLIRDEEGLYLKDDKNIIRADFMPMLKRIRKVNVNSELLIKAAKIKGHMPPFTAIDATAGFGEDSFLLAAAGFDVIMYEKNPTIAALLEDALQRAIKKEELFDIVSRMRLVNEDSIEAMKTLTNRVDVIYLDPMFPKRRKSGLIKKKFQLIQQLEEPCNNEAELLEAAMRAQPYKIIIKRPAKGEALAGKKPDYSINGKTIRYDVYLDKNAL